MHHDQVERLFDFLKDRSKEGLSILFVSHRFDEVYAFCKTATVLREGISVGDFVLKDNPPEKLIFYMTGQKVECLKSRDADNRLPRERCC
jgi:ABC-type sugar transport system ATPase subunit